MDEEKNALTDANEIMEEREKMRRLREVESKPNEINPYILTNDLFFIIVIIYYFYLTKSNRRFLDFYLPNKYKKKYYKEMLDQFLKKIYFLFIILDFI